MEAHFTSPTHENEIWKMIEQNKQEYTQTLKDNNQYLVSVAFDITIHWTTVVSIEENGKINPFRILYDSNVIEYDENRNVFFGFIIVMYKDKFYTVSLLRRRVNPGELVRITREYILEKIRVYSRMIFMKTSDQTAFQERAIYTITREINLQI